MLVDAIEALQRAHSLAEVQRVVRVAARALVDAQGATVVLRQDDHCYYADEDAISPLWKGQRFPITECISGWAMLHRQPAVVPDICLDERIPLSAYRPTFVHGLAMVPIRADEPIGAIGTYWARPYHATEEEIARLTALAAAAATALARFLPEAGRVTAFPPAGAPGTRRRHG